MTTLEIPRERWATFLERLGVRARGIPVRLEIARLDLGDQEAGDKLPLRGLALEEKGSDRGDLLLSLGTDEQELTHVLPKLTRLCVGQDEAGALAWLAVEGAAGEKVILSFERLPALDEQSTDQHGAHHP